MPDPSEPIAVLRVSFIRRALGALAQAGLGVLLISVAAGLQNASFVSVFLIVALGLFSIWQAWRLYHGAARDLILTRKGLYDSAGREIAALDQIASVDRGTFAFKPSNGFLIRLKQSAPKAWVPGLWWRFGTRVGVGGATNGKAARDMADVITLMLADPDFMDRPPEQA